MVRPSRAASALQRLSTQIRAAGRTASTMAAASCRRVSPVSPDTPGASAATGRMPRTGRVCCGPMVTRIFWAVRGPRASAVTRRLPMPSTSTGPSGGSRARSSAAPVSITSVSRSSRTLTLGISSVTYRPRGLASPSRAISTRVTVTPPRFAVASRTPAGSSVSGPRNSSSAISVVHIFPHSRLSGACRPLFFVQSMGKLKLFQTKIKKTLALVRQIWYHKVRCYR